jgi:ADP-L-glycero-D-manno-heptose 6-epimerase
VREQGYMKLFRSHRPDYDHGMQMRDFVYVKDAAMATSHFIDHAADSGLYNIGTGRARAFRDLASAVMANMGQQPNIEFIDMPEDLRGKYQYFTEADVAKLRQAGYDRPFMELEDGVADYVRNYLVQDDPYC